MLVAKGQVNQAISMLKNVLTDKPDNIDVHIKLKDIYLRTGMMAEAARECGELARIYQRRGEDERARDYAVRANRLTQLIARPSGVLPQPERKPVKDSEPRVNTAPIKLSPPLERKPVKDSEPRVYKAPVKISPPIEPKPKIRQITSHLDADRAQPAHSTLSVVPPAAIATKPETIAADLPPALDSNNVESPPSVSEATLEAEHSLESVHHKATSPAIDAIAPVLTNRSFVTLPVESNRRRVTAAAITSTVFALGLAGVVIGGFAYDAHLDRQYKALALAAPPLVDPSPPAPVSESVPIEENEPIKVDVTPAPQTETLPARPQKPGSEGLKNERPAPTQPTSEPPKVVTRPSPLPPRIGVNPDSQGYTENRTPAGLAGDVPVAAAHPAEPPPQTVRRSAGVVSGAAVIKVDPVYPKAARESLQTGVVAVEVTINEQGNVTSARALSGPALLRNAAVFAARGWKFKPSLLGGVPVATTTFNFKL